MRHPSRALVGAVLALGLLAGSARCSDVQWNYQWTPNTQFKIGATVGSSSDYILATPENSGTIFGNATIGAVQLQTFSAAPLSNPAKFINAPYSLSLTIFDQASGKSGTLSFGGVFNGTLSSQQANLGHSFTSLATQSITLGGNLYTVTLDVAPPGGPKSTVPGSITAAATVNVSAAPEPGTLALAGLGLSGLGVGGWLKRRRTRKAVAAEA
jgi:hypothetical protein